MTAKRTENRTALQRIVASLQESGLDVEALDEGALVHQGETRVALFTEPETQGGVLVRLHLDLELYVEEDSLPDILMGMNLMNQGLDYGALILDPVEPEMDDEDPNLPTALSDADDLPLMFAVLGRSVLWLRDLERPELERLQEHLTRFEREITETVERTLHGPPGMSA